MKALTLIVAVLLLHLPSLADGKQRRGLDLVLYFTFDEGTGKTTKDLSRFRNHGNLEGKWKWHDGKFGKAIYLCREGGFVCGKPGLVRTPASDAFAMAGKAEITLMAWINVDPAHVGHKLEGSRAIIYNRPQGNQANYGLRMDRVDPSFFYRDKEDQDFHRVTGIWDAIPLDQWTHIAVTATFGNPESMKVYLNGKPQLTNTKGGTQPDDWSLGDGTKTPIAARGPITIGGYGGFGKFLDTFQGSVDEVMIWKGTFTEAEINEIMQAPGQEFLAVEPHEKLATTWGTIKRRP